MITYKGKESEKVLCICINIHRLSRFSCVRLCTTPWTIARQAPPSMGFSRQEYWSGLPFPSPGDLPDLGIEPRSPALQADALTSEPPGKPLTTVENMEWECQETGPHFTETIFL